MSKVELLKDVLIEIGDIERYFGNRVPVNLWRGKRSRLGRVQRIPTQEQRLNSTVPIEQQPHLITDPTSY